ncbi:GNAT family N-acetyltransferase [Streptosporangiaceae bacterium NEAU-GS5]|nr:GNAT family N-acetyltransferase [Streptosporangiaceae bacterium NEAU-GS5]
MSSERVTLRPLTADDETEFTDLVRASRRLHHPWMALPDTLEAFHNYFDRFDGTTNVGLVVCRKDTGEIAGNININSIVRGRAQSGSVGYAAFAPAAGQGYLTEGLRLAIRFAFDVLLLHRLEAAIQPENERSLLLIKRVGFVKEGYSPSMLFIDGQWRDHERWALISDRRTPHPSLPGR